MLCPLPQIPRPFIQEPGRPFQSQVSTGTVQLIPDDEPLSSSHSDIINVEKLEASSVNKPEGIQEHWYWNPCFALRDLGNEFRYRPPVAPVNVAATFTADTATSTTSTDTSGDISSDS